MLPSARSPPSNNNISAIASKNHLSPSDPIPQTAPRDPPRTPTEERWDQEGGGADSPLQNIYVTTSKHQPRPLWWII